MVNMNTYSRASAPPPRTLVVKGKLEWGQIEWTPNPSYYESANSILELQIGTDSRVSEPPPPRTLVVKGKLERRQLDRTRNPNLTTTREIDLATVKRNKLTPISVEA